MITSKTLRRAMHKMAAKKGDFTLFATFMRSNGLGLWDLVVAAPWLNKERYKAMREVAGLLREAVGKSAISGFAKVVPVDADDPSVQFILTNLPVEDGEIRIKKPDLFDLEFDEAIIFRAKKPAANRNGAARRKAEPVAVGADGT